MRNVLLKTEKIGTFIFSSIAQGNANTGVWRVINVPDEVLDEEVWERFSRLMIEPIVFDGESKGEIVVPYENLQSDKLFWRTISDNLKRVRLHLGMTQGEVAAAMGYGEQFQKRFSFWEGGNRIPSERFSKILTVYASILGKSHKEVLQLVVGCADLQVNEKLQSDVKAVKGQDKMIQHQIHARVKR